MLKGTWIAICHALEALPGTFGMVDPATGCHRVPMNSQYSHKSIVISICGQQGRQDGGTGGNQGPARPPDMQTVRRRERRHGCPLAQAFDADFSNGKPGFNEACGHG